MGTHISRVKSVDLDAWTDEQVELMVKWGNAKCNSYWEAKLPEGYVPDGLKIENFIRTKYDLKKWVGSSLVPNPMTITVGASEQSVSNGGSSGATTSGSNRNTKVASSRNMAPARGSGSAQKVSLHSTAPASLLDDDFGSFTSSPLPTPTPTQQGAKQTPQAQRSQQKHEIAANAPPALARAVHGVHGSLSTGHVPNKLNERTDLKKSILSLYSLPSSSLTHVQTSPQTYGNPLLYGNPYTQRAATNGSANTNGSGTSQLASMSDSLMGLNFGLAGSQPMTQSPMTQSPITQSAMAQSNTQFSSQTRDLHAPPPKKEPPYKNEWSDSSSSVNNWGSSVGNSSSSVASPLNGHQGTYAANYTSNYSSNYTTNGGGSDRGNGALDDDLFKNVWS